MWSFFGNSKPTFIDITDITFIQLTQTSALIKERSHKCKNTFGTAYISHAAKNSFGTAA